MLILIENGMITIMKNLFLLICMFFLVFFHPSFASDGNLKIESFNKSKKILRDIHKEHSLTFYCQCKYKDKKPNWKSCGFTPRKDKKRASRIEWEHILPASHFGIKFDTWKNGHPKCKNKKGKNFKGRKCTEKIYAKYRKMQADLYNLQPAIGEVNGLRSNYQIDIIKGEVREFGQCDIEIKNKKVEPSEKIRGDIARIYMYMEQSYPKYIKFEDRIKKLIDKWDKDDPVDDWECRRINKIQKIQGNINQVISSRCQNRKKKSLNSPRNNKSNENKKSAKILKKKYDIEITKKDPIDVGKQDQNVRNNSKNYDDNQNKSTIGSFVGAGTNHALK